LLPPLRSASHKDDDLVPVPAKIDPITGAEVDSALRYSGTNSFHVGKVTLFHADDCGRDLRCCRSVEIVKPLRIGTSSLLIFVLFGDRQGRLGEECDATIMVTVVVPTVNDHA